MKNKLTLALLLALTTICPDLMSQNWQWEWAEKQTKNGVDAGTEAMCADYLNNIYCYTRYDSVIYISDTSFHHPHLSSVDANIAISRYTDKGTFIDALDIYVNQGEVLGNPELHTDSSLNIFLSVPFANKIFMNDTFFTATNVFTPDVLLAKLTPEYDLLWSGLITSPGQDDLRGMVMSDDGYLYLACNHYVNDINGHQLNYLNQDTSATYDWPMNTLAKIDLNSKLIWKKEIRSEWYGTDIRDLIIGDDGLLYLTGQAYSHISIDNDTIFHPNPLEAYSRFLTVFTQEGELVDAYFFDWDIWLSYIKVDSNGDIFVSGSISGTAVIGADTIIVPENEYYGILGKFDSELAPIWYRTIVNSSFHHITLDTENLIFSGIGNGAVQIADTVLQLGYHYYETFIGEFDEVGQLKNIIITNSSKDLISSIYITDNCKNPIISGHFTGAAIFGDITINSSINSASDGFIGKLIRNVPPVVALGPDSAYCEEYTLNGPEGFKYYSWNDSITTQHWYTVHESQPIYFACANAEGCWSYDTININIHHGIEIELGPDSSYCEEYTLNVPEGCMYYSWNDSITTQHWYTVHESQLIYFACATEEGCWSFDTININIHPGIELELGSDSTMSENDTIVFSVPDQYESYLWSNGATTDKITIIGSDYGIGTFPIWVVITDGPCTKTDTLLLTIKSESGMNEIDNSTITIYPNPFSDSFNLDIEPEFQTIEICELNGMIKFTLEINHPNNKSLRIGTENLNQGIYIFTITTHDKKLVKKIIKI
jgi:hypothetical protein